MNCSEAKPLLDPMLDGYLDAKDMALVLDHLKSCLDCSKTWDDMNKLRARFLKAQIKVAEPPQLLRKISAVIENEEKRAKQKKIRKLVPIMMVALAASTAIGIVAYIGMKTNFTFGVPQPVSVVALVDDVDKADAVINEENTDALNKDLGYQLRFIKFPNWNLEKASLYRKDKIALMQFTDANSKKLACYQTWEGHLSVPTAQSTAVVVNGKKVQFGEHGGYHFALWSQNGRDYLLVSPMDQASLQNVISSV